MIIIRIYLLGFCLIFNPGCRSVQRSEAIGKRGGPVDASGRPLIQKLGTIDLDLVETTPIVFRGKPWRFEWVRYGVGQPYWNNLRQTNYFRFRDPSSGSVTPAFADGHEFRSAFVDGKTVYVTGTLGRSRVNMFAS